MLLSTASKSIARRLLQQQQQLPLLLSSAGMYTWDGKSYSETGRPQSGRDTGGEFRSPPPRDYNEIRLRGTVSRVFQADNRVCRFTLTTKRLQRRVNPGGSWRWTEAVTSHYVYGAGANLPRYLAVLSVGARVDMSAMIFYRSQFKGADGAATAATNAPAAGDRQAALRLVWIKPVEEEEMVDVNFDVQLEDS